ncbi:MAG: hypothetical protein H8D80_00920 [Proteobacteria bacterium]|nr:hypothetical protein [Pseudomonadota bacterium]
MAENKKNKKTQWELTEKNLKDLEQSTSDLSGRASRLFSATSTLDDTVLAFQEISKNVKGLNESITPFSKAFKSSLTSIERSKIEVFDAAQSMVESNSVALDNMNGWSERSKFVMGQIAEIGQKALLADTSEARNLRKDLTSMRSAANLLTGEQRKAALEQISQGEIALEKFSGKWGIVAEAFSKKFNKFDIVEKMLGGGAIGGMVSSMIKISAERKKTQKLRDYKAANMSFDKYTDSEGRERFASKADARGSRHVKNAVAGEEDPILSPIEKQVGLLEKISTSVRASLNIQSSETVSAIEAEEAKREGGEQDARTMSQKIIDSASAFAVQIRSFLWEGLIIPATAFLWKGLIVPIAGFIKTWLLVPMKNLLMQYMILPLKKLLWDSMMKPLGLWLIKYIASTKVGGAVGRGFGAIKDKYSAAGAVGKGGLLKTAEGVTDKAGKATKAAPKKGVLKRIADGIKSFGNNKVLKGAINIGILALSLIPLAISLKMFSSVSFGGVVAFAASLTVLVAAVKLLAGMKTQVIQGALALGVLSLAMIPLAIGLNLMKSVGIGTIIVLAGALVTLGVAANIFGSMAANPLFWLGILAIGALGVALLPLAFAMKIAAEAFEIFLGSLDVGKMMMLGPMLLLAAPGLMAFGLASLFASPGLIMLGIAGALFNKVKLNETLPPILESFSEFSEKVNPRKLIASAAGILAIGGALVGFAIAGAAAAAIATAGNVAGNLMTLGGLLASPAPGPFEMLKMFIAFGNLSGQLKEGASAIEEIQASMMKFALMDTEGMKDGVESMVSAIDEFTAVLFRAKLFGGIGDTLLGGDPLEAFIKLSEAGDGIAAASEGIKKLGETFVWFSSQKQHMEAFRGGMFSESMFENMMEDLNAGLEELDIEQFEEKIELMERLGNAIQNLTKSGSEFATKGAVVMTSGDTQGIEDGDGRPILNRNPSVQRQIERERKTNYRARAEQRRDHLQKLRESGAGKGVPGITPIIANKTINNQNSDTPASIQAHDNKISIDNKISMLNKVIEQNAILISQRTSGAGKGGGGITPIIANKTINNQNSDTIFATSAITVNPESTLRQSARNIQDDAIL